MQKAKIREITIYAILIALVFVMAFTPYLGYISIGIISFTTLHLVVIMAGFIFGIRGGIIVSLAFGFTSWLQAMTLGTSPFDILCQNPLISILPRLLFGIIAGLIGQLIAQFNTKNEDKKVKHMILLTLSAGVLTLVHTFLFVNCAFIFGDVGYDYITFITFFLVIGVILEVIVAMVTISPLIKALQPYSPLLKGKKYEKK